MRSAFILILGLMTASSAIADNFSITSSAFPNNGKIPVEYTCNGKNISPPLKWDNIPANTKSFVLVLSAPHWITSEIYLWTLYNIPATVKSLSQGAEPYLPHGTLVGTNFYDKTGYSGPCPPDARIHEYVFTLYALDTLLSPIEDNIDPEKLLTLIKPYLIKQTKLTGFFNH